MNTPRGRMAARPARRQRGLAAVELALLLPVMFLLMFGVAELGRVLYQYNTLTKTVRDAAQYLARHGMVVGTGVLAPTAAEETIARNLVVYGKPIAGADGTELLPGLSTGDVEITYQQVQGASSNNAVTVTVDYDYQALFGLLPEGWTQGHNLTGDATFTASLRMRGV